MPWALRCWNQFLGPYVGLGINRYICRCKIHELVNYSEIILEGVLYKNVVQLLLWHYYSIVLNYYPMKFLFWKASGFTIRGTCINPEIAYNQPGCVSYDFFRAWDPEFVDSVFQEFDIVSKLVSEWFESHRQKQCACVDSWRLCQRILPQVLTPLLHEKHTVYICTEEVCIILCVCLSIYISYYRQWGKHK